MNMALNVQFSKYHNHLIDEDMVIPRLVNQQTLNFDKLCEYLADGSTVTATDVAAVMKRIETKIPFLLGMNTKVVCSPEGLTFRPSISGSLTQSGLKAKLQARLEADPTADIDVDRVLNTSDLTVDDLTASISIDLPKKWHERFHIEADFKRIVKDKTETTDATESTDDGGEEGPSSKPVGG